MNPEFLVWLYNQGYAAGHEDTVEGRYTHILQEDMHSYHADAVKELIAEAVGIERESCKCEERSEPLIHDNFGSVWSKTCPECGKDTMQVIRPGVCKCVECG